MEPSQVDTFGDGSRGDDNFLYVVMHKPSEGDADLTATLGSCCNDDHQQGPEAFINGESIDDTNIVIWYVPQMVTDASAPDYYCWTLSPPTTYPCFTGPMFVPINSDGKPASANFTHNGPIQLGNTAEFTNGSAGTPPLTYDWDFGDGVGTSTDENPSYDYTAGGTYTVTLTTNNGFGSDSYSLPISVTEGAVEYFLYTPFIMNNE
jgi:PKD repeat protein